MRKKNTVVFGAYYFGPQTRAPSAQKTQKRIKEKIKSNIKFTIL